nr:cation-transporting P-type ATPase [Stackebrandtia nassauensis]
MTSETGLSRTQAAKLLASRGPNEIPVARRASRWWALAKQLTHFFALLLWAAAGLAFLIGMPQLAVAIVIVVVVNAGFAHIQEYRADRAAERLRDLMPANATVIRDGHRLTIPAARLVPGDLVLLEAGDRISADLRVVGGEIAVDESMLTGEGVARRVTTDATVYAGTFAVEGAAAARVSATGVRTRLAQITMLTRQTHRPPSPLAVRLNRVVTVIAVVAVAVGAMFFGISLLLGSDPAVGFVFALGVTVALVPEGLLPTVTLSLAWGARAMADKNALVKRLESVETLGSVTYICTDKTGTLTRNQMTVTRVWTPRGLASVTGEGYEPRGDVDGPREAVEALAYAAVRASSGRLVEHDGHATPHGDPMEVAFHVLALRCGIDVAAREAAEPEKHRYAFDSARLMSSTLVEDTLYVKGAPEAVFSRCRDTGSAAEAAADFARSGLRVLAVAARTASAMGQGAEADERDLTLLGVAGLADPPRPDVADAIAACRRAGIRLTVVTGDHPATASAVARRVGLLDHGSLVITGAELPGDEAALAELLDRDGVVVARVTPEDKLRIARALQNSGHIVAMTGDGVNDAPALRTADIGIAMGASGSDIAREAADLVLLDDHFATIVAAVERGRATFVNIRRFLTYHLTDNVAELAPFVVWALSGGSFPLAIGVLQILALDIGTDLLPALALGAEPPNPRTMTTGARTGALINRGVLIRAFGVLGPAEVLASLTAFTVVLLAGGWLPGSDVPAPLLHIASGTAFAAIVLGQLANAFACRSVSRPAFRIALTTNRLLLVAVGIEIVLLGVFLGLPPLAQLLGGGWPSLLGWTLAVAAVPMVLAADAAHKTVINHRWRTR